MSLKSAARKFHGGARTFALKLAAGAGGFAGRNCLDRPATLDKLKSLQLRPDPDGVIHIDSSACATPIDVLSSGVLRMDGRDCLDIDYGSRGALKGWTGPRMDVDSAAVLWSHRWAGYYHWMIDIVPKIAAMQSQSGHMELSWLFPRSGQRYEVETLELLGVAPSRVIDTTKFRSIAVQRANVMILPGWFEIQKSAALLRTRMLPYAEPGAGERIFLKRRGRRICQNEDEVIRHLSRKGFVMIEDVSRSVTEQMGIFSKAKVIVAPHGAALANLLWCSADCTVIECFAAGYSPPYYRNLAAFTGMTYASVGGTGLSHWTGVSSNIHIDISDLDVCMDKLGIS